MSITMEAEALKEASGIPGMPKIFITDQGGVIAERKFPKCADRMFLSFCGAEPYMVYPVRLGATKMR